MKKDRTGTKKTTLNESVLHRIDALNDESELNSNVYKAHKRTDNTSSTEIFNTTIYSSEELEKIETGEENKEKKDYSTIIIMLCIVILVCIGLLITHYMKG